MTDAFQDLDRLMMKATEMVKLAEAISNKVSKDPTNEDNELSTLRTHLLNLGIASPVTKLVTLSNHSVYYHLPSQNCVEDQLALYTTKNYLESWLIF